MDLLLIDDSNIFIEAKKLLGKDVRVDYDRFVKNYISESELRKIIVGSTPSKNDSFWSTMKYKGFEVYALERTNRGEKAVDTKIIAEGVEHISREGRPGVLTLLSGDYDMYPLIEKAKERNWVVNIWSWENSLSKEFRDLEGINLFLLDEIVDGLLYCRLSVDGVLENEYFGDRKLRLKKEQELNALNKSKISAQRAINSCKYLVDKDFFLTRITVINAYDRISEIQKIIDEAYKENTTQKQLVIEQAKQDKFLKREKRIEVLKEHWVELTTGAVVVGGLIIQTIKTLGNKK